MGAVVQLQPQPIRPKTESRRHLGQTFILKFNPNSPADLRWEWHVKFTVTYDYFGAAADIEKAAKLAKRKIDQLSGEFERAS